MNKSHPSDLELAQGKTPHLVWARNNLYPGQKDVNLA
jgi:hypothetical protein